MNIYNIIQKYIYVMQYNTTLPTLYTHDSSIRTVDLHCSE